MTTEFAMTTHILSPGDSLCWVQTSTRGRGFTMRRRKGYLVEHLAGGLSRVQISKGKTIEVATEKLLPGNAKPLMEFMRALAGLPSSPAVTGRAGGGEP